jgi:hypothetical protein
VETKTTIKKINVLEGWKYTEKWLEKKFGPIFDEKDKIQQALQSKDGSWKVRKYIYDNGPNLAAVQRHINRFIDIVNEVQFDETKGLKEKSGLINRLMSLPNNLFDSNEEDMDRMYAYNYKKAPRQIVEIIDNIDRERRKAKETFDVLVRQLKDITKQAVLWAEQEKLDRKYQELLKSGMDYKYRQGSDIPIQAIRILNGEFPLFKPIDQHKGLNDFYFIEQDDPDIIIEIINELYIKVIPQRFELDPIKDTRILTFTNHGLLGAKNLNLCLQQELKASSKKQTLKDRHALSLESWEKSGYNAVIIPLATLHTENLCRELLYTAIILSKYLVLIVGMKKAISIAVHQTLNDVDINIRQFIENFYKGYNNLHKQMHIEMTHSKVREGIVYVLTNDLMPGLVKIGFTAGNPDKRVTYINEQYALPSPFRVEGYVRTKDPYIVEQRVHVELADRRVSGEFFKIDPFDALSVIRKHEIS